MSAPKVKTRKVNGRGRPLGIYYQARCAYCNELLSNFDFSPEEAESIALAGEHLPCWASRIMDGPTPVSGETKETGTDE